MEIAIPSKGRPKFIARETFKDALIFVEPQEYELYKNENPDMRLVNIEATDKGVAYVYNFILNYMKGKFFLVDDDVRDLYIREGVTSKGYPKLAKVSHENILLLLDDCEKIMNEFGLAMLCLKENFTNWYRKKTIEFANVGYRATFLDKDIITNAGIKFDENLLFHNDTDFYLQIFMKGLRAAAYYKYAFSYDLKNKDGGCNFLKTKQTIAEDAERCVAKWNNPLIKTKMNVMLNQMGMAIEWKGVCPIRYWDRLCV